MRYNQKDEFLQKEFFPLLRDKIAEKYPGFTLIATGTREELKAKNPNPNIYPNYVAALNALDRMTGHYRYPIEDGGYGFLKELYEDLKTTEIDPLAWIVINLKLTR